MSCPNSDPIFDKTLSNFTDINSKYYPSFRRNLYYGVCIWVRLLLILLVFYFKDKIWMPYLVGIICAFTVIRLSKQWNEKQQWWSKRWHLVVCFIVFILCVLSILPLNTFPVKRKTLNVVIPSLLLIGLLGGIVQSFFIKFC